MRFNASQKARLYKKIFAEEFDMKVLESAGVILKTVILHTVGKHAIMESFEDKKWKLFFSMIVGENWYFHMEPISLIADYYGEKLALFMTFLIHHVGQMVIPSFFGLVLWGYHIYYGV